MTLLFMDGFDAKDTSSKWVVATNIGGTPGYGATTRFGAGYAASFPASTGAASYYQIITTFTPSANVFLGAAIQSGLQGGQNYSVPFHILAGDNATTYHLYLVTTPLGAVQVWRGDGRTVLNGGGGHWAPNGTMLASSANGVLPPATWHYVELGATLNATTGTAIVKVDGVQVINFTGNTKNGGTLANIDTAMFQAASFYDNSSISIISVGSVVVDDLYVCNGLGSANNTFLGDVRVQTLLPSGAGSSTALAPTGSGSNYLNVAEVPDNPATYNGAYTTGLRDTYALGDTLGSTGTVLGLQQVISAFKSDAGTASIKAAQKSGATVSYGATRTLATGATTYVDLFETNPATSAAYTVAGVNALEAGAEVA